MTLVTIWALVGLLSSCKAAPPARDFSLDGNGTWFVSVEGSNANDGRSMATAFATISRAARVARPSDTIVVGEGKYEGGFVTEASGTEDARITYIAEDYLVAVIDGTGNYTAWENRGDYVDIIGFDVMGADYLGIYNLGSHVRIAYNEVHHLAVPSCNSPNGGAGINHGNYDAHGNETISNVVHNIIPPGPYCNLIHGIYHSNYGGLIQNNIVHNVSARGIQMWHAADAVTVTNNLIFETQTGILVGADDGRGEDYLIANNILAFNEFGIRESGGHFHKNNRYIANLFYRNDLDFRMVTGEPIDSIWDNPRLANFQLDGTGDYRLRERSPAIDAGYDELAPQLDFDGAVRPQGDQVDIGPFEYVDQ